ncbi:phage GP46 family protein [Paracandidimonas soli]|uniref:Phage gp46-like protein n=1 Tax=Paracandidimonas soli TaxID=1917182 RepID=A0A4R3UVD3_9BURK|nr:phage GP46 family protein [Paracandidimonas soli]TCU93954.1 phage gp46-like protein [Paracandidimonas soli]
MQLENFGGDDPLQRAVVISLFTWRRALPSDPVDDDRCGWWGDSYPSVANDRIGSRLWLLRRRSLTAETVRDAQAYAEEALRWMVDDGVLLSVVVTAQRQGVERLVLFVRGVSADGQADLDLRFNDVWRIIQDAV